MNADEKLNTLRRQSLDRVNRYRSKKGIKPLSTYISASLHRSLSDFAERTGRPKKEIIENAISVYIRNPNQLSLSDIQPPVSPDGEKCPSCNGYGCDICNNSGWRDLSQ